MMGSVDDMMRTRLLRVCKLQQAGVQCFRSTELRPIKNFRDMGTLNYILILTFNLDLIFIAEISCVLGLARLFDTELKMVKFEFRAHNAQPNTQAQLLHQFNQGERELESYSIPRPSTWTRSAPRIDGSENPDGNSDPNGEGPLADNYSI